MGLQRRGPDSLRFFGVGRLVLVRFSSVGTLGRLRESVAAPAGVGRTLPVAASPRPAATPPEAIGPVAPEDLHPSPRRGLCVYRGGSGVCQGFPRGTTLTCRELTDPEAIGRRSSNRPTCPPVRRIKGREGGAPRRRPRARRPAPALAPPRLRRGRVVAGESTGLGTDAGGGFAAPCGPRQALGVPTGESESGPGDRFGSAS